MVRNFLLYLLSIILFGVFAVFYNSYSTALLFIIWTSIPIGTILMLIYNYFKLDVRLKVDSQSVSKGNHYEFMIEVVNASFLPIPRMDVYLEYSNRYDGSRKKKVLRVAVDSKCNQLIKTDIVSNYIGIVDIKITRIKVYDILLLSHLTRRKKVQVSTVILPSLYEEELRKWNHSYGIETFGEVITKRGDDPSEVFNIREYQDGDRENRIHYKLSTKHGKTLTKEYSANQSTKRMVVLDTLNILIEDRLNGMDVMLSICLSEIISIINEGEDCSIFYITSEKEVREVLLTTVEEVYLELEQFIMSMVNKHENGKEIIKAINKENNSLRKELIMFELFHEYTVGTLYSHITYISSSMTKDIILWAEDHYKKEYIHYIYINDLTKLPFERILEKEQLWNQEGLSERQMFTPVDINKGISQTNVK